MARNPRRWVQSGSPFLRLASSDGWSALWATLVATVYVAVGHGLAKLAELLSAIDFADYHVLFDGDVAALATFIGTLLSAAAVRLLTDTQKP